MKFLINVVMVMVFALLFVGGVFADEGRDTFRKGKGRGHGCPESGEMRRGRHGEARAHMSEIHKEYWEAKKEFHKAKRKEYSEFSKTLKDMDSDTAKAAIDKYFDEQLKDELAFEEEWQGKITKEIKSSKVAAMTKRMEERKTFEKSLVGMTPEERKVAHEKHREEMEQERKTRREEHQKRREENKANKKYRVGKGSVDEDATE